ncbi:MAG: hypothetical protein IJ526_03710 [Lachnospiraceae bacterium]|nr:hypothetical protein [Lachnospiraceae bacterium]
MIKKKYYSMLLGGTLSIMVVSIMLMSDSLIAGVVLGQNAVSGITLVTPLYSVAAFFGTVFSLGVPILYSTERGAFREKEADRIFKTGFLMAVVTGVVLFVLVSLFGETYLRISNPSTPVYAAATDYLSFIKYTIFLLPLQALLSECIFADGDESISTISNLVQAIGNVVCSIILSRIMGVRGIALASFLFNCISLLLLVPHFFKKSNTLKIGVAFSFDILKKVVRYSAIDAASYLFIGILVAVLNMFVGANFGSGALILVSVISLARDFQLIFDGIGEAITPILTIYLGEKCISGVGRIYSLAKKTAIAEGVIVTLLICISAPFIPDILQITNPAMAGYATGGIRIISIGSAFVSLLYLVSSYDLLIDRISLGLLTSALRDVLLPASLAVVLGYFFGIYGVCVGIGIAPALAVLILNLYLQKKYPGEAPLLLGDDSKLPSYLYGLPLEEANIVATRNRIEADLRTHSCDSKTVNNVMVLFEDVCMLLREKNSGVSVEAECSLLILDDRIRMIFRDTGASFDITDADMDISSLRSYIVSNLATHVSYKRTHLPAMSFNRNVFEVKR